MTKIITDGAKGVPSITVETDDATNSIQTVDYGHHEVHEGDHYCFDKVINLGAASYFIKLVTPDTTKWAHFLASLSSSGPAELLVYEAVTGGMTGGSAHVPLNNNRNSVKTSGLVFTIGVATPVGFGTTILHRALGAVSVNPTRSTGGDGNRDNEKILKQNTVYCIEVKSLEADNVLNLHCSWYEHIHANL